MSPADELAPERHLAGAAAGSGENSDQHLRAILENLERAAFGETPWSRMTFVQGSLTARLRSKGQFIIVL
jgi:hypothetical protein